MKTYDDGGVSEERVPTEAAAPARLSTGNPQTDAILGGGFLTNSITILMGQPGTGKTVLAEQILFHNGHGDRPVLYLTTLSEPLSKVVTYLQRFEFYDESQLGSAVLYDDLGEALVEEGPQAVLTHVREAIRTLSPKIIMIDSFKAVHDLTESPSEMRRLIAELAGLLSAYDVTTFLLGEYSTDLMPRLPEFAVADAIVELARRTTGRRDERYLRVLKLRGSTYQEGSHAFRITAAGLQVHPRFVAPEIPPGYSDREERVSTGVGGLDAILQGGLWSGSNTLVLGSAGSGKTTFGLSFAVEGVRLGEPTLFLNLQENPVQLARTIRGLGYDPDELQREGLHLHYASPVELQIDSIVVDMFETIRREGIRRVVIDAIGDLALAASDPERLHDYLYSLVQHFVVRGVTSVMTLERDITAKFPDTRDEVRLSSISDALIELGHVRGDPARRTIRVVKARGTAHDLRVRELSIHDRGMDVADPVTP